MGLKAQNEVAGLWPPAAMGAVERMVRRQLSSQLYSISVQVSMGLLRQ